MGTRSITVFEDGDGREIVVMYRQYDGYPSGHGRELADLLKQFDVVNGLSGKPVRRVANGAGCLAAQVVAAFKTELGGIYLYPAGTRDTGEEWIYTVRASERIGIMLKVQTGAVTMFGLPGTKQTHMPILFQGPPADFDVEKIERAREAADTPPNVFLDGQDEAGSKP